MLVFDIYLLCGQTKLSDFKEIIIIQLNIMQRLLMFSL